MNSLILYPTNSAFFLLLLEESVQWWLKGTLRLELGPQLVGHPPLEGYFHTMAMTQNNTPTVDSIHHIKIVQYIEFIK